MHSIKFSSNPSEGAIAWVQYRPFDGVQVILYMEMEINLKMKDTESVASGTIAEEDAGQVPIPCHPSNVERIGDVESSDHTTITIPEPQICRICDLDEEVHEDGDALVELGCNCKGHMSRMHRNCILKWFGVRMLLKKLDTCELCNTVLHPTAQLIVAQGVSDHVTGGRAVLLKALKSSLAPHIEVERAATYQELVQLLIDERAQWYRHQSEVDVAHIRAPAPASQAGRRRLARELRQSSRCRGASSLILCASIIGMALYASLTHHRRDP